MKEFDVSIRIYILQVIRAAPTNLTIDNYDAYSLRVMKTKIPNCDFLGLFANEDISNGII